MTRKRRDRPAPFLLEVAIDQGGFLAGIIAIEKHGRTRYWLERPGREIREMMAPSSWDARRRMREWITEHYERGKP